MNVPAGGVDCRKELSPQHETLPSARNPQVCNSAAEIWVKGPAVGVDCP